jgi:hypothetical protein
LRAHLEKAEELKHAINERGLENKRAEEKLRESEQ